MAECIIARRSIKKDTEPVIPAGQAGIVVTVFDSDGNPIPNIFVTAYSRNTSWINTETNNSGKVLFAVNNGTSLSIKASNASLSKNYIYLDQYSSNNNNTVAVGTTGSISYYNITLDRRTSFSYTSQYSRINGPGGIFNNMYGWVLPNETQRFRVTNGFRQVRVGGAGGGGGFGSDGVNYSAGGGGGQLNIGYNVNCNKDYDYHFVLGMGGDRGNVNHIAGLTGGTSSALGVTGIGGTGGSGNIGGIGYRGNGGGGGNGANGVRTHGNTNIVELNAWIDGLNGYGGGGGGFVNERLNRFNAIEQKIFEGGSPGGGNAGYIRNNNTANKANYTGQNGVGGGGGGGFAGALYFDDDDRTGGIGGHGIIEFINPY